MNNREDWWEYTKRIIRSYPALRRKAESVGDIPCTPAYGASGGHSSGGSTVSKQLVAHLSSARDNLLFRPYQNGSKTPENQGFPGFYYI